MDRNSRIWLSIPDPGDFDLGSPYIPVPSGVVNGTIDLLQCMLAQYRADEGPAPDDRVWDALAVAAGQALGCLLSARAAYYHRREVREPVEKEETQRGRKEE
jgi:hypothetical protein